MHRPVLQVLPVLHAQPPSLHAPSLGAVSGLEELSTADESMALSLAVASALDPVAWPSSLHPLPAQRAAAA
jgi:hypothetical protein